MLEGQYRCSGTHDADELLWQRRGKEFPGVIIVSCDGPLTGPKPLLLRGLAAAPQETRSGKARHVQQTQGRRRLRS